jgi:eukaryotic-like serine/threonine-protein kinase
MSAVEPASTFRFGTFEVDVSAGELRRRGLRIKLQDQPFHLLVLLLQHPGQLITRDELRHTLWSDHTFVDFDRGLNRAVNKLRAALCDSAESPRFIETLPRRGYRFIAPVTTDRPAADEPRREEQSPPPLGPGVETESTGDSLGSVSFWNIEVLRRKPWFPVGAMLALVVCVAAISLHFLRSRPLQPVSAPAAVTTGLPSNHDAARFYAEGLEHLRVLDANQARDLLQKAIAIEPEYALSHTAMASAWAKLGYDDMAKAEAKRGFDLSRGLPPADRLLAAARFYEVSERWTEAIEKYRALAEFFPDSLDFGLGLAEAQLSSGSIRDAMKTLSALDKLPSPSGDDARIDMAFARAAESLGDFKTDLTYSTRAAGKAQVLGASLLLAQARDDQAWALSNLGRSDDAASAAHEAQLIFANAGDKRGLARSINYDGILEENQGSAAAAKTRYEQALAIYQEIGYKLGVANELDDLGDVLFALGDLEGSRTKYESAMAVYREIGHENGVCLAKGALGSVLLAMGDNNGSIHSSQEAVGICTHLGDRSKTATALLNLAQALRLQGKTPEASKAVSAAVSDFEEIGDRQSAARARLMIAELLLDTNKLQEAHSASVAAANEFAREKAARDAALAYALLSHVLLGEGSLTEARKAIQESTYYLSRCNDEEAEMTVAITAARVEAMSGVVSRDDAARTLQQIATRANHLGFVSYELEPQLTLAEIELTFGDGTNARNHLEAVQKEALDRGFGLIATKASGDLKNLRSSSATPE